MKKLNRLILLISAASLLSSAARVAAQPQPQDGQAQGMRNMGGMGMGMDPQQMQQRMNEFFRERLAVTNDAEWKVIEGRLAKVTQLRMETLIGGMGGMRMGGNRGGGGFPGMGQPSPEAEALQKAIESNASVADLKTRLEKFREARRQKQEALAKAQDELRQVLSLRQEATLVTMGMLE